MRNFVILVIYFSVIEFITPSIEMGTEDKDVNTPLQLNSEPESKNDILDTNKILNETINNITSDGGSIIGSQKSDSELLKEIRLETKNEKVDDNFSKILKSIKISEKKKKKSSKNKIKKKNNEQNENETDRKLFKKFDPYNKKVDLVPPTLPKIPPLMGPYNPNSSSKRKPKDIIDRLPDPIPPPKFKIIKGKKVMLPVKYKPKRAYYKKWKKTEKAYPNVDGNSFIESGLSILSPSLFQKPREKLYQMRSITSANPSFNPGMHGDLENDYFELVFPRYDPSIDRLKQIRSYIEKWMGINPQTEKIEIKYYEYLNKTIKNRVIVDYFNNAYYKQKNI